MFVILICALSVSLWINKSYAQQNQPPVVNDDSFSGSGGNPSARRHSVSVLLANDTDPDGPAPNFKRIVTAPQHGTILVYLNEITYTQTKDYIGSDSYVYEACDSFNLCDTATVTLNNANQAPQGGTDSFSHRQARLHVVSELLANDSDPDGDTVSFGGLVTGSSVPMRYDASTSRIFLDPLLCPPDSYCTGNYIYKYKVCDSYNGTCSEVSVNLIEPNRAPIASNDYYLVNNRLSMPLEQSIFANDKDPDNDSFGLVSFGGGTARGGNVNLNYGTLYYTPPANFLGWDSFTYRIKDSFGAWDEAQINFYVAQNDNQNAGPSCPAAGKPVNPANGNMYLSQSDYSLPGVGPSVNLTRTYNSMIQTSGLFGLGWTSNYDVRLYSPDNYMLVFTTGGGREVVFGRTNATEPYSAVSTDVYGQATKNTDNTFTVTMKDGTVYQFNSSGRLAWIKDRNNNQTTLTYLSGGRLEKMTDPFGKVLNVTTNATTGLIEQISDVVDGVTRIAATYTYYPSTSKLQTVSYPDGSKFDFNYTTIDGKVLLTEVKDAQGKIVEKHEYYATGNHKWKAKTSEIEGGQEKYTLDYLSDTFPYTETEVTDGRGNITKYYFAEINGRKLAYKTEGLCSCGGGSGSQVMEKEFDTKGNVTKMKNALLQETTYSYNTQGDMLTSADIYGTQSYTYNSFGQALTMTDRLNAVTRLEYNSSGNLTKIVDPLLKETRFEYHSNGRGLLTKIIGARNTAGYTVESEINWDTTNGVINWVDDAKDNRTEFTFDSRRRVKTVKNAKNETTSYNYDGLENTTREMVITLPDSKTVKYKYDDRRLIDSITDTRGKVWDYSFDNQYRLSSVTDPLNHRTNYSYDTMSNLSSMTNAKGEITNYEYDEFNRLKEIKYAAANTGEARLTEKFEEYDLTGRLKKYRDTSDRLTTYNYQDTQKKYSVTNPDNETTEFEYNSRFQTVKVKDAINQVYEFVYDPLGRLLSQTRGNQTMSFLYDEAGNRKQRTDYNGQVTKYVYDKSDNLERVSYMKTEPLNVTEESSFVAYTYDVLNRMITAENTTGTVSLSYDNRGRLQNETDVFGKVLSYAYTENSTTNRKTLTYQGTLYSTYDFDDANRL